MRPEQIRNEIEKVAGTVAKAAEKGGLSALERDIILGRLRVVYDAVLSMPVAAVDSVEDKEESTAPSVEASPEKAGGECVANGETSIPGMGDSSESGEESGVVGDMQRSLSEPEAGNVIIEMEREADISFTAFSVPPVRREVIESLYGSESSDKDDKCEAPDKEEKKEGEFSHGKEQAIGDIIAHGNIVFNETISVNTNNDLASVISSGQITGIRESLGLNDRFLLTQELFNNDPALFEEAVSVLDGFTDMDDAYIYLQENFSVDPNSEGLALLVSILERKLS